MEQKLFKLLRFPTSLPFRAATLLLLLLFFPSPFPSSFLFAALTPPLPFVSPLLGAKNSKTVIIIRNWLEGDQEGKERKGVVTSKIPVVRPIHNTVHTYIYILHRYTEVSFLP